MTNMETSEGKIEVYSHNNGRIGVLVEINVETEFASRSPAFTDFVHEIALHVAASSPLYVSDADIPAELLEELAAETAARALRAGKPAKMVEKIVAGALEKYKQRNVLLRQAYIRDEEITIAQLLNQKITQIGETIVIRRFIRWEINPDDGNNPMGEGS